MSLSNDLLSQFAKLTNKKTKVTESTVYGTVKEYNGSLYVQFDGSELLTPVSTTASYKAGERVAVQIKNHTATVTGNITSPSARNADVVEVKDSVFGKVTAHDLETINAEIDNLIAITANIEGLEAVNAEIENLKAEYAQLDYISAKDVEALNAKVETIRATVGEFTNISASNMEAINASISNLVAYNATFTYVSVDIFEAMKAEIENADLKYANIDFSNIKMAAVEELFTKSGIIKDLVVGEQKITGELVGVTIKGDLIEAGTVVADKLVVKGSDGILYKLNVDAVGLSKEEAPTETLHGSIITTKSIVADKIAVTDLVAFGATIGGFKINDDSIHSVAKDSVNNTTRGIYFDNDGQIAFGDSNNFVKFYKDSEGVYRLAIAAESITFGSGKKSIEDEIETLKVSVVDILRVTRYYTLVSSTASTPTVSASTKPPSGWTTTEPSYSSGSTQTLYFVDLTEFSDGGFKYSDVSKSSSYEAAKAAYNKAVNAQNSADAAAKTATNFMRFETDKGLIVGDLLGDTLGKNVLIDSDSVDIRNGDTILASYGDNNIYLAKNNSNAIIDLCDGYAQMNVSNISPNGGEWMQFNLNSSHSLSLYSNGTFTTGTSFNHIINGKERICTGILDISSASIYGTNNTTDFNPELRLTLDDWFEGGIDERLGELLIQPNLIRLSLDYWTEDYLDGAGLELIGKTSENKSQANLIASKIVLQGPVYPTNNIILDNNRVIYGLNTSGATRQLININTNNNTVIGYGGYNASEGLTNVYGNGVTITAKTTIDLKGPVTFTDAADTRANLGVWMYDLTTNTSYPGLARPDGTTTGYVRTPQTGIIPFQQGGHGTVGTSSWPFNNGYFKNVYTSGTKMHYASGDSVNGEWNGGGFVSNSSNTVYFSIPLAKPVIGATAVTVTTTKGLVVRQHKLTSTPSLSGGYVYGSSSNTGVVPTSLKGTISWDGNSIRVEATMPNTTNVINNSPCGVNANMKFTFS